MSTAQQESLETFSLEVFESSTTKQELLKALIVSILETLASGSKKVFNQISKLSEQGNLLKRQRKIP
ncbi:MAG: hypothetical protein MK132_12290 [Lentisphaerales bacterium]|nr:hypothetical protein [Lentisphaerales bacterium]